MAKTVTRSCNQCRCSYDVRVADLNRGWGLCCSKACAAKYRGNAKYRQMLKNRLRRIVKTLIKGKKLG